DTAQKPARSGVRRMRDTFGIVSHSPGSSVKGSRDGMGLVGSIGMLAEATQTDSLRYLSFDTPSAAKLYFKLSMNSRALVLNASFDAINVCNARRAVVLILKGVAFAEESAAGWIHSARFSMPMPSVIRLTEYIHIPFERKSLSRKNILLRDHNTCQYCGRIF